ncbi:hypothetical protein HUU40_00160 [candidate division KSB1 bacterium]|nr:hypothetical protein [candidate division KSB1 bacterium]
MPVNKETFGTKAFHNRETKLHSLTRHGISRVEASGLIAMTDEQLKSFIAMISKIEHPRGAEMLNAINEEINARKA